jgi:RNA polymerase sigma-70 factor (ECF subfamily)
MEAEMGKQPSLVRMLMEHRDLIWGFILSLTRDHEAAEEVFQEVSVAILEEAQDDLQVARFLPWVREVARRRVAGYYRKKANPRTEPLSDSLVEVIGQAFAEYEPRVEEQQLRVKLLMGCVERLTGRSRQLIDAFYRGRRSIKDLAAELNWKPESIRVALSRARKALADCVAVRLRAATEGNA